MMQTVKTPKERLLWLIEQRGTNPSDLSGKAGIKSRGHVGLLLSGNIKTMTRPMAEKLARATGASVEWLLTGEGDPWATHAQVSAAQTTTGSVAHAGMLDALAAAFRAHPTATIEDLDAVRALVTAGHARLIPAEHAVAVLGAWLTGAQTIRARGEAVTIDALDAYLRLLPSSPSRVQH